MLGTEKLINTSKQRKSEHWIYKHITLKIQTASTKSIIIIIIIIYFKVTAKPDTKLVYETPLFVGQGTSSAKLVYEIPLFVG